MPWHQRAKKDAKSCEKLRGAANGVDPEVSEWGNPAEVMFGYLFVRREANPGN